MPILREFHHERLDVYQAALDFVVIANTLTSRMPPGNSHVVDQLRRAASSVVLNVAEGAGEFSPRDKARFYRISLRSATECAAALDIARVSGLPAEEPFFEGRELLLRIVSMLTRLVVKKPGTGTGAGTFTGTS